MATPAWFDVTAAAYGAKGDGTTNDTTAIQAAITAAEAVHGVVYVPPPSGGFYKTTAALTVTNISGVTFKGDGPLTSIIKQTTTTANGLTVTDSSGDVTNIVIDGVGFIGPGSGSGVGVDFAAGVSSEGGLFQMNNVNVLDFGSHGLEITDVGNLRMDSVYAVSNGGSGFYFNGGTLLNLRGCYAGFNGARGMYVTNFFNGVIQSCGADSNGIGYEISACNGIRVIGSDGFSNAAGTTGLDGSSIKFDSGSTSCSVEGYTAGNNGAVGLYVTGGSEISVIGFNESAIAGATASIKTDSGNYVGILTDFVVATPVSLAGGTIGLSLTSAFNFIDNLTVFGVLSPAGTDTATNGAVVLTPAFANGTAAQLSDNTRDHEVSLVCTTAGTAFSLKTGPTSGVAARTIVNSRAVSVGQQFDFRLPAGWYVKWNATGAAFADQSAQSV